MTKSLLQSKSSCSKSRPTTTTTSTTSRNTLGNNESSKQQRSREVGERINVLLAQIRAPHPLRLSTIYDDSEDSNSTGTIFTNNDQVELMEGVLYKGRKLNDKKWELFYCIFKRLHDHRLVLHYFSECRPLKEIVAPSIGNSPSSSSCSITGLDSSMNSKS